MGVPHLPAQKKHTCTSESRGRRSVAFDQDQGPCQLCGSSGVPLSFSFNRLRNILHIFPETGSTQTVSRLTTLRFQK